MFVRVKSTPNSSRQSVRICEAVRRGNKVSRTMIRHVGAAQTEGLPLGYHLFHGAIYEGHTLREALKGFAARYRIERIICVCERAMLSAENLQRTNRRGGNTWFRCGFGVLAVSGSGGYWGSFCRGKAVRSGLRL